jgi:hypothetical protein
MFPPIGDYAFLSNCEQNCLIALEPEGHNFAFSS